MVPRGTSALVLEDSAHVQIEEWSGIDHGDRRAKSTCTGSLNVREGESKAWSLRLDGDSANHPVCRDDLHGYSRLRLAQNPSDEGQGRTRRVLSRLWPVHTASVQHITVELC